MAQIFPSLDIIANLKVSPTPGELHILKFLRLHLDDTYEVFFQPFLNGDNPDIILLRENSGAMIIEVKDWNLDFYELGPNKNWILKNVQNPIGKRQVVKSPIQQVFEYKENLYNLHIDTLLEKRIRNPKFLSVVTCCVYLHNASKTEVDSFVTKDFSQDRSYLNFLNHFELLGHDSLSELNFRSVLKKR